MFTDDEYIFRWTDVEIKITNAIDRLSLAIDRLTRYHELSTEIDAFIDRISNDVHRNDDNAQIGTNQLDERQVCLASILMKYVVYVKKTSGRN